MLVFKQYSGSHSRNKYLGRIALSFLSSLARCMQGPENRNSIILSSHLKPVHGRLELPSTKRTVQHNSLTFIRMSTSFNTTYTLLQFFLCNAQVGSVWRPLILMEPMKNPRAHLLTSWRAAAGTSPMVHQRCTP